MTMAPFDPSRFVDPDAQAQPVGNSEQFDSSRFVDPDAPQQAPQQQAPTGASRLEQLVPGAAERPGRFEEVGQAVADFAAGINRTVGPIARLPARGIASLLGSQEGKRALTGQALEEKKRFEQAQQRSPLAATLGQIAPTLAVPGGITGGLLRRVGTGALAGGAIGGAERLEEGEGLLRGAGIGAALGATGGVLGETIARGVGRLAGARSGRLLQRAEEVAGVQRAAGAAEDIPLSLSERLPGSEIFRAETRAALVTKKQQGVLQKAINQRDKASIKKFDNLVGDLVREGDDVARQKADDIFRSLDNIPAPAQATRLLTDDPIIGNAFRQVQSNPNLGAQNLQPGSFGQLRLVKEALDNEISTLKRAGANVEVRNLTRAQKRLVDVLDKDQPNYKLGRSISQRLRIKGNIQGELNAIRETGEQITPENIFTRLFANKDKRAQFLSEVKAADGDVEAATKIINTFKLIQAGGLRGKLKRAPGVAGALSRPGGVREVAVDTIRSVLARSNGKALTELLTDPALQGRIKSAQTIESAIQGIAQSLTKATVAATAGQ